MAHRAWRLLQRRGLGPAAGLALVALAVGTLAAYVCCCTESPVVVCACWLSKLLLV